MSRPVKRTGKHYRPSDYTAQLAAKRGPYVSPDPIADERAKTMFIATKGVTRCKPHPALEEKRK